MLASELDHLKSDVKYKEDQLLSTKRESSHTYCVCMVNIEFFVCIRRTPGGNSR